jgi:hypothetical protein
MKLRVLQWTQSLTLLKDHSENLLSSLFCINSILSSNRQFGSNNSSIQNSNNNSTSEPQTNNSHLDELLPKLFSNEFKNVTKLLLKKFPDVPDLSKVNGYAGFQASQSQILDQLSPYFEVFTSVTDFNETCLNVLQQSIHIMELNVREIFLS